MGALEYRPACQWERVEAVQDLDRLASECRKILQSKDSDDLDRLFAMGGSSGGARPKVIRRLDDGEWLVKFPSSGDPRNIGRMEYEFNLCARACGIEIPEVRLFPSKNCAGYFGSRRFDREGKNDRENKLHMFSASALLEVSHRVPALDYETLMSLTWQLTKQADELKKLFTRMCFNVLHTTEMIIQTTSTSCVIRENGVLLRRMILPTPVPLAENTQPPLPEREDPPEWVIS